MDRKEAIERLFYLKSKAENALINSNSYCDWLINDVKGTINALSLAIEALQEPERIWIPVSERLPDELVAVNVTWINRCPQNYYMHIKDKPFTDTAVLYRGKWYWWDNTIIDYLSEYGACIFEAVDKSIDILAWQPLPEPYKESEEE